MNARITGITLPRVGDSRPDGSLHMKLYATLGRHGKRWAGIMQRGCHCDEGASKALFCHKESEITYERKDLITTDLEKVVVPCPGYRMEFFVR